MGLLQNRRGDQGPCRVSLPRAFEDREAQAHQDLGMSDGRII